MSATTTPGKTRWLDLMTAFNKTISEIKSQKNA
jgi:hypothetical protein